MTEEEHDHFIIYKPFNLLRWLLIFVSFLVLCSALFVIADYFKTVRIVDIGQSDDISPVGGELVLSYNRPASLVHYESADKDLYVESFLSKDGLTETHRIIPPTPFNKTYRLRQKDPKMDRWSSLVSFFKSPESITLTTCKEKISIKGLIPPENSQPIPESLNNQFVIEFEGNVIGKYGKGINIPVSDMEYVKLSPPTVGYYRWSSESILTFNFTEDKPQFETTYTFEVFPDKFVNTEYQSWVGDKNTYSVTTSNNEVYIAYFSLSGEVSWQAPIRIEFSGNMVGALDVLKKKSQDMVPIDITPSAGGTWMWINARVLEFQPDNETGLPVRETVTVKIHPEINTEPDRKWRDGDQPAVYSFYVLPREQSIVSYNLHGDAVGLENDLIVRFSRSMVDTGMLHKKLDPDDVAPLLFTPNIDGHFTWVGPDKIKFHPDNLWSELTQYEVRLNPAFNPDPRYDWSGTKDFTFKTVENVVHADFFFTDEDRISPSTMFSNKKRYSRSNDIRPELRLWILFDRGIGQFVRTDMDLDSAIVITPSRRGEFTWLSNSLLEFVPHDNWSENTEYSVKLKKDLLHHPQQHFPENKDSFSFTTGENIVSVANINSDASNEMTPISLQPDKPLVINFSKNVNTVIKVGKTYSIDEIVKESRPVYIEPESNVTVCWDTKRHLNIQPKTYWKPDTTYKVTFNPELLPQEEASFEYGNSFYIKTLKNLVRIDQFSPQGQVGRLIVIDVQFSKNIKPANKTYGEKEDTGLFEIKPFIKGEWVWLADNKLQFKPAGPLTTSCSYKVFFDPNKIPDKQFTWHISPEEGKKQYSLVEYGFHTPALHVVKTDARFEFDRKNILKQKFYLDIELSAPVDEQELRKHFNIWYNRITNENTDIQVPLLYKLQADATPAGRGIQNFSVVSDWIDRPADDRKIEYTISGGLNPIDGNLKLAEDYSGFFYQEKPKHIRINRLNWVVKDRKYEALLSLSAPVEPDVLKEFLTISSESEMNFEVNVSSSGTRGQFNYEIVSSFEPGVEYTFQIGEGMMATDGAFTPDPVVNKSRTPNLSYELQFAVNGSILSKKDLTKVPVLSTNVDSFYIIIDKIFANNVNYYINNRIDSSNISDVAQNIHTERYRVKDITGISSIENKSITTHINLSKLLNENTHGLYRITVSQSSYVNARDRGSSRWFLATDIGMIARTFEDNIAVWVNSLHSMQALPDVKIEAVDKWNQVIGSAYTNTDGLARIVLDKNSIPTHIVAKKGSDFSFLDLRKHRDNLTGYDIEGISSTKSAIRSFIYSDRGVYRPGDIVHLVSVTRGREGILPELFPVVFLLTNPVGKHVVTERYTLDEQGLYVYDFHIPAEAKTGRWNASILWQGSNRGAAIGNYTFQVEEFIPNKIKVELEQLDKNVYTGESLRFKVTAKNLFGPPAADRPVSGTINLRANRFKPQNCSAYVFGHDDNQFQRIDEELAEVRLDNNGQHIFSYKIPDKIDSPVGLSAYYSATVIDDGGRGVSSYKQTDILLYSQYVGVRRLTDDKANINIPVGFKIINVFANGGEVERSQQKLSLSVYRNKMVSHYRKNERGYYRYVTEKERIFIKELEDTRDVDGKLFYTPEFSGEHILEIRDMIGNQVTRYKFNVGGIDKSSQFVESPDKVELVISKKNVAVNDTVQLEINAPFPGKVLIIGEQSKILFSHVVDMPTRKKIIPVHIKQDYLPNFYINAIAIRPVQEGNRNNPVYASGLINVNVRDRSHEPSIKLTVPNRANPYGELNVELKVSDTNNSEMYYTIAAVDVGILDLTQFQTPDLRGYFNQKRRLEVGHYSMYPMIMPYDPDVKYMISPSGDSSSRSLIKKKRVSPDSQKRVKSVALWSGLLKVNERGEGSVTFKIPDFDGTLRVMAVAFGNQRFASAQKNVVIRDRLVMKPTLPRFMATDDDFVLPVTVFNGTENNDTVKVSITSSDHVKLLGPSSKSTFIPSNGEASVDFAFKVNNVLGVASFDLITTGAGEKTRKSIKVPVRAPGTYTIESDSGLIDKNTPRTITLPDIFIKGTEDMGMSITSNKLTQFQNSLSYLLRYPHGCLEQTTSKLFPLLFYSDLAKSSGDIFTPEKGPRYYLKEGIAKIERMQLENGAFSYWEGRNGVNNWAFVYACHFLVEAQKNGLKIDEDVWNKMIYHLNESVSNSLDRNALYDSSHGVNHYLYMLYVLSLSGENVRSKLNYVYDNYFNDLKPHDKARLASAFAISGEKQTAYEIINNIGILNEYNNSYRDTGGNFASNVRDLAIILDSLVSVDPQAQKIPVLVETLANKAGRGRWGSTQENAFAFLSIGKAVAENQSMRTKAEITLGDGTIVPFEKDILLSTPELLKGEVRLEVVGDGEINYAWEAAGIIKDAKSLQQDNGIQVRRIFLNNKGEPLSTANVKQGSLIVVEIKVKSLSSGLKNVVITDLLPTGLEIENPRLSTSSSLSWIKQDIEPDYLDIRDDRINIFLSVTTTEKTYYYTTRAVTVGNFKIPAVRAEAMYDPDIFSEADSGQLKILDGGSRSEFSLMLK